MSDVREQEVKEITFGHKELDPAEEQAYLEKIAAAKKKGINALKGSTPIGHVERPEMPDLARRSARPDAAAQSSGLTPEGGVAPRPPGSPVMSQATIQMAEQAHRAMQEQTSRGEGADLDEAEVKKEAEEAKEDLLDLYDFMAQDEASRVLNNKKRRTAIEARCAAMNFEDLLMKGEVQQVVPIQPGKYEPTFRSLLPDENLFIKQFLAKDEKSPNDAYALEKYSLCQLACALVALNGKPFIEHRDAKGDCNEDLFRKKFNQILKMSSYVIADLSINYLWFDLRVRRLLAGDALGNG